MCFKSTEDDCSVDEHFIEQLLHFYLKLLSHPYKVLV